MFLRRSRVPLESYDGFAALRAHKDFGSIPIKFLKTDKSVRVQVAGTTSLECIVSLHDPNEAKYSAGMLTGWRTPVMAASMTAPDKAPTMANKKRIARRLLSGISAKLQ